MSKCQKNKYAAGGKCGSMSGSDTRQNPEINSDLAAFIASREKQDALFTTKNTEIIAITTIIPSKIQTTSDIDTVLDGDF